MRKNSYQTLRGFSFISKFPYMRVVTPLDIYKQFWPCYSNPTSTQDCRREAIVVNDLYITLYTCSISLQAKILSLPWIGSGTRTDKALRLADSQLFTAPAGDRPAQPNVLVVITDGRTNPQQSEPYPAVLEPLKASCST